MIRNSYQQIIIFIFVLFWGLWSNPEFEMKIAPDSWDYIAVAEDFSSSANILRSFGYPMLIRFCILLSDTNWETILFIVQLFLHGVSVLVLRSILVDLVPFTGLVNVISILISIHPSSLFYVNYLLPEYFMSFALVLFLFFSKKLLFLENNNILLCIVCGFLSGLAFMIKAVWILGFMALLIPIIIFKKKKKEVIIICSILITTHFLMPAIWETYKSFHNQDILKKKNQSIVVNVNFAAIRLGLVKYGEGTSLYDLIMKNGLMDFALKCNGDDNKDFRKVYNGISFGDRYDYDFTKKIIQNAAVPFLFGQLSNWYRFISNRMHIPNQKQSFSGMPSLLKYIYIGSFNFYYRPLLGILLIISLVYCFYYPVLFRFSIMNFGIIIYFLLVLCVFTIAPHNMIRMRQPVDALLLLQASLPFLHSLYQYQKSRVV